MKIIEQSVPGYERVVWCREDSIGYRGIIAIHDTRLGPAVGGTRFWHYNSDDEALTDVLRLARGMTYKNALAELPFGGGKAIIIGNNRLLDREKIFRTHGRFINSLGGKFITGEDVGTSTGDMEFVHQETQFVGGLQGRSGDPSPRTARGVFRAMQAAAKYRWGSDDLSSKTVSLQGCGHVGYFLAVELHGAGAKLVITDIDPQQAQRVATTIPQAAVVSPEKIFGLEADIFAPCALGGILNGNTIPQLRAEMIVGAANNQLLEPHDGTLVHQRGILYAPDYAVNSGGVISGCCIEMLGWDLPRTLAKIDCIYGTLLRIFEFSERNQIPTSESADLLAKHVLSGSR
ncbi:MAG TPA: Glu/Leu/Phe/Val dehydrogenase dimerization domain-containing protein [Candidatus Angelobacter sp.]|jgi:leucine dehydrogenase|nr:Glu/Leu/Phe/Val dehydrogenase dimerization domain-containing protein [Candidatus Angelobacter sp.]